MVEKNKKTIVEAATEGKLTVKTLGVLAGIIITVLGAVASTFAFIDARYVHQDIYDIHVESNNENLQGLDEQTAAVIESLQEQNQQEFNRVYKAIKDGTALPLIVRRDILLARGDALSSEERAELTILETKLDELNIQ